MSAACFEWNATWYIFIFDLERLMGKSFVDFSKATLAGVGDPPFIFGTRIAVIGADDIMQCFASMQHARSPKRPVCQSDPKGHSCGGSSNLFAGALQEGFLQSFGSLCLSIKSELHLQKIHTWLVG